ncbi:MAG: flagellar motor protein MotB [Mesorhizobium sp.]|uniref:OmpA family protein n=1 Tax=Mesorhizobium sp. TaxID=1871066 RepID=UPI0012193098|nr:OmpA family protein [Mesorhizobium sp.]TIQ17889.1 MAG: flagellar motor protein MotB [Mesorhizobium sp.]
MKRQPRILAGTALGLLMASAPLGAFPLQGSAAFDPPQSTATPLIPVQSNCPEGEAAEGCPPQAEPEQKPRKKRERQAESAPAEQAAPSGEEQQGGQRRKKREQQQQEAAPAERAAPASDEQPEPRRKKREREQQQEAAPAERPAEQAAPASDEQPEPRRKKRDRQQQEEAAPAERPAEQAAPASDEQPEPRSKKREREQQQEAAPAERPAEQAAPASDEQPEPRRKKREREQQQEAAPSEQPARKQAGEQAEPIPTDQQTAPAEGDKPRDQARERGKKPADEQPVSGEQPTTGEQPAEDQQAAPAEGEAPAQGEAPVFDSQKDARRKRKGGRDTQETVGQDAGGQPTQQNGEQAEAPKPAPIDPGPPPTDDRTAQQAIKLERMVRTTEEKGRRVERVPEVEDIRRRPRPRGVDVVRELGDRVILQFNNQTIVESDDTPRMRRGARNVYYEELSGNRTREIVERDNGIQIVTIRNRYGDVVQRSRIAPDGREYVLSYVDERYYEDDGDWRDPGDDLPPIRIDIPREEYILDSEEVEDPDDYYAFLEQPPVERVQRLYSIDEVKRSARVRDIARRIDLDTLNFEFGSASIPETEVQKLEGVASAMEKLLEKNPAETFLIEGHTDAVGRPEANLALSDRRAEAVAEALTNAFSIPPENLTTQGYGEEYLKVDTSEPERENRRVAIRRITSLVAPVASAN